MASAQNPAERRRAYRFSLGLFGERGDIVGAGRTLFVFPYELVAPDFRDNENFDVLIGMDLLSRGRLTFEPDRTFSFVLDI